MSKKRAEARNPVVVALESGNYWKPTLDEVLGRRDYDLMMIRKRQVSAYLRSPEGREATRRAEEEAREADPLKTFRS